MTKKQKIVILIFIWGAVVFFLLGGIILKNKCPDYHYDEILTEQTNCIMAGHEWLRYDIDGMTTRKYIPR